MKRDRGHVGAALAMAVFLATASLASANPADSQENSLQSQVERMASDLKEEGTQALEAAAAAANNAVEESQEALAKAEKTWSPRFQAFQQTLSDQKGALAMMGEDAAAAFDTWKEAATESWNELWAEPWSETWSESWAEMQNSASRVVEWFRAWFEKQPVTEKTEIPA